MVAETNKINKAQNVTAEKWTLPSVNAGHGHVFRHETLSSENKEAEKDGSTIPTADDIEQWHEQAKTEGYAEGIKQAQQETAVLRNRLLELIDFFENPLQSLNEEVEQQLSLLAVTLAQQLVRREIRVEPGEIIPVIRESVKLLPASSRKISIFLNPEDLEMVKSALQLDNDEEQSWKLIEDPMITRGGCEIKADRSVINATLENRLQALAASILGGERSEDQDVPTDN